MRPLLLLSLLLMLSFPALAEDQPRLRFPVDCDLGESCWLMNLADTDPAPDSLKDYLCGPHTYEGHDGTDIAIRDEGAMLEGVNVVAVQAGTVTRLRDSVDDGFLSVAQQGEIKKSGKECGNGLLIDIGRDWTAQYCHLKKSSFKVKQGDAVKAGQVLAQIGLSGITDHPHLHVTLRHKGETIDPFTGAPLSRGCGQDQSKIHSALWGERVTTESFNLYDAGFATSPPDFGKISQGQKPSEPDVKSDKLIFWFAYFAAQEGDSISLRITSPSGIVLADHQERQPKNRARQYYFTGKEMVHGLPEKGLYKGEARITRINEKGETRTETLLRELTIK